MQFLQGTLCECRFQVARYTQSLSVLHCRPRIRSTARLIVLPAYLFNFKAVPNQGLNNKSAWLIVQSFKSRVYIQLLACKTAERLTGRRASVLPRNIDICITKMIMNQLIY